MIDGGLRNLFKSHLPRMHIQPIESWGTGVGLPDFNYCFDGKEGWVECKVATANAVTITPGQVSWAERRLRAGGRILLAVRRHASAGPRRGAGYDELWLFPGCATRHVAIHGLLGYKPLGCWGDGPAAWDWPCVQKILLA